MCAIVTPIIFPTLERLWEAGSQTKVILTENEEKASPNDFVLEGKPASADVWIQAFKTVSTSLDDELDASVT